MNRKLAIVEKQQQPVLSPYLFLKFPDSIETNTIVELSKVETIQVERNDLNLLLSPLHSLLHACQPEEEKIWSGVQG